MKISTHKECVQAYNDGFKHQGGGWDSVDDLERTKVSENFSFSVIVEGAYGEDNVAEKWCADKFGEKDIKWKYLWYGKIDYDYGFWEFFFKDQKDANQFNETVSTFYVEINGKKWKTDGKDKIINL